MKKICLLLMIIFNFIACNNLEKEEKAREIFGERIIFDNAGMTTDYMYDVIVNKSGKKLPFEKQSTYQYSLLNIFVDDLENVDIEEYRKKIFEFGKYMNEHLNICTALNVELRDNKSLRTMI